MLKLSLSAAVLAMLALLSPAIARDQPSSRQSAVGEQVVDLTLAEGLHQRALYVAPPHPRATLIMLPGGTGDVGIQGDGDLSHDDNFVVRTRASWVTRGYAVLIPDTIEQTNLRGKRSSPAYGQLVVGLAAYAKRRVAAPVFLIGTSQGTIAAINGAAHAPTGLVAGVVLTESVSRPGHLSRETVFDADPQDVAVPALVIANQEDTCDVAPPSLAPRIVAAMTRSPSALLVTVTGGIQRSKNPCGSLSPHGYYGIESQVVGVISNWLRTHGG